MKTAREALVLMALASLGCGGSEVVEMAASVRVEREYIVCSFDGGEQGSVTVVLPPDATAGDQLSTRISASDTEDGMSVPARDERRNGGYLISVLGNETRVMDRVLAFRVPEGRSSVRIELLDPEGRLVAGLDYPVSPTAPTEPAPERLGVTRLRGLLFIEARLDGRLDNTTVMLDDEELEVWTESPRGLMTGTRRPPERAQLTVIDGERLMETWLPNVVLDAEPSWVDVSEGELVSVRIQACGLSNVADEDSPSFFLTWVFRGVTGANGLRPLPYEETAEDCAEWTVEVTAPVSGRLSLDPWVHWR